MTVRGYVILLLAVLLLAVPGAAQLAQAGNGLNATLNHIPLWFVFSYSAAHTITSYNFTPTVDLTGNNTWAILGSNDGYHLDVLDVRVNTTLMGGVNSSFNMTTTGSYRYYYVDLLTGFSTAGDYLEVHLYASGYEPRPVGYVFSMTRHEPVDTAHLVLAGSACLAVAGWRKVRT
jgi:hypothetical protein